MEINGLSPAGGVVQQGVRPWQLGERLLVEVVQKVKEQEGIIRVNGQDLMALLETSTKTGDKFWVKVSGMQDGNILMIREPSLEKHGEVQVPQQVKLLTERGLPSYQPITSFLKAFSTSDIEFLSNLWGNLQTIIKDKDKLRNILESIPRWEDFLNDDGAEQLVRALKKLGIDYEQRLQQLSKLGQPAREMEKADLKETLKYVLLETIPNQNKENVQESQGTQGLLLQLLQNLTGQQLWFRPGALDNAYILLQFPVINQGQLVPIKVAVESARKGTKMDGRHCRIALEVVTQQLGEVGIDAFFDENMLSLRILINSNSDIPELLEEVLPETREKFNKLGFTLQDIVLGDLNKSTEFRSFLQGIRRSGVDVKR